MPVAKTSAERQAAYKAKADERGERRLDVWMTEETMLALDRLERHYECTRRELLRWLVSQQDKAIKRTFESGSPEEKKYFAVTGKR